MSFTAANGLKPEAVKKLMGAIRVTFVQNYGKLNSDPTILGTAKLDVSTALTAGANGEYKANLYLYSADGTKLDQDKFGSIMNGLIDKTHTKVAGVTNPRKTDMDTIVQYYTDNQRIDIVMLDGSGIYANIANLVGDYTASGFKVKVTTSAITASVPVTMSTSVSPDGLVKGINTDKEPAASVGGAGTTTVLSDTYPDDHRQHNYHQDRGCSERADRGRKSGCGDSKQQLFKYEYEYECE